MPIHLFSVPDDGDGIRLDRFLVSVLAEQSRSRIQRLIKEGHVQVAGRPAKANQPVKAGQQVSIEIPEPIDPVPRPEALPLPIVYQDRDVIVVDKPAGMVVHPAAGHASGTLVNALLHHIDDLSGIGGEKRPGIVHRLDRGTSGLMVVAKHDTAHEELARQFRDREVEKEYDALVWGEVQAGRRIDAPIGRDPVNRKKMSARARRSREAVTRIVRAEHLGRTLTLARIAIQTGRTHQIRVHLSAIGHPIVGDSLYGGVHRRVPGDLRAVARLERPFLHAARLVFKHPGDVRRMEFSSALPDDLQRVMDELRARTTERLQICSQLQLVSHRSASAAAIRGSPMPIVYKGRKFSVEVDRVRFPNGSEHEMEVVHHPPSVVLLPDAGRRACDPDSPVSGRAFAGSCGSCRPGASSLAKRPTPRPSESARRRSASSPGASSGCAGCSRRRASATRS